MTHLKKVRDNLKRTLLLSHGPTIPRRRGDGVDRAGEPPGLDLANIVVFQLAARKSSLPSARLPHFEREKLDFTPLSPPYWCGGRWGKITAANNA
jgi:hypothetical protein